jgi:hypothetical protein
VTPQEQAGYQVRRALQAGRLVRAPACQFCGVKDHPKPATLQERIRVYGRPWSILRAHHDDYARPLDVVWLCGSCHKRCHVDTGADLKARPGFAAAMPGPRSPGRPA